MSKFQTVQKIPTTCQVNRNIHFESFQLLRNTSQLQCREQTYSSLQVLLNKYWTHFSEKPPKGFGKFFGERSSEPPPKPEKDQQSTSKPEPSSKSESSGAPKDSAQPKKPGKPFQPFEFKFDVGSGGKKSSGGGKSNSDREKWFTFGMIGSALAIAAISYYGYSYEEISWKDLTKYSISIHRKL